MSEITLDRPRVPAAPPAGATPPAGDPHATAVWAPLGGGAPPAAEPGPVAGGSQAAAAALHETAAELMPWARDRLLHLVGHASPNGDAAALDAVGEVLTAGYAETGAETMTLAGPHGDHHLACWPGADQGLPPVLLLGHHDTVPGGADARTDGDTTVAGTGALDGRSGLVVAEMAMRLLNVVGLAPAQPVRLFVSADSLMGSPTARPYLVAEVARAGAVLGLAAPRPDGVLTTGHAGGARVLMRVGPDGSGHPASAIEELLDQLGTVRANAVPLGAAVNVGRIGGGIDAYAVAEVAGAELGVRFTDPAGERAFLDGLTTLAARRPGLDVQVEALSHVPAWPAPEANPLLDWVAAVGERHGMAVVGASACDPRAAGDSHAGDANHAGVLGAPTLDGFGGVGQRVRDGEIVDELVRVDSLMPRALLLAALLALPLPARPA